MKGWFSFMVIATQYGFLFYLATVFFIVFMTLIQVRIAKSRTIYYAFITPFSVSLVAFIFLRAVPEFFVATFFIFGYFLLLYFILRSKAEEANE